MDFQQIFCDVVMTWKVAERNRGRQRQRDIERERERDGDGEREKEEQRVKPMYTERERCDVSKDKKEYLTDRI